LINSDAIEPIIEFAIIAALMVFVYRGGWGSGWPLWTPKRGIAKDAAFRLVLFAVIVVLLFGFLEDGRFPPAALAS
jgi:hypothetical protein